jgi:DNA-binding CsgD family transcriptional regulator
MRINPSLTKTYINQTNQEKWDDFKKWWVSKNSDRHNKNPASTYINHPLLTPAMDMLNSVIVVVDIPAMQYTYTSPNYGEFTGWKNREIENGGVEFVFGLLPPDDQAGVTIFGKLMNEYFRNLPDIEKGDYRAYWDFRFRNGNGDLVKCFQNDRVIKYSPDGHIEELLVFNSKIDNVAPLDSQHLRITNVKQNYFYKYDHKLKTNTELKPLTKREMEITKLISKSNSLKKIASLLNISFNTVRVHHANALCKMQVNDSIELVNLLRTWGFI